MKLVFVSSEGVPFSKTGGLGDVLGALPKALKNLQIDVKVILPLYQSVHEKYGHHLSLIAEFTVPLNWRNRHCRVFNYCLEGIEYWFIEGEDYFYREELYGYEDDGERFAFFSKAALGLLEEIDYTPDILHLSDWQTALVPVLLKTAYKEKGGYSNLKTVLTIHNIDYQGTCSLGFVDDVLALGEEGKEILAHQGQTNFLKGGIVACDRLTTVSPTYAKEVATTEQGQGLEDIIASEKWKLTGILNGIDTQVYDPQRDYCIAENYNKDTLEGKAKCKEFLQQKNKIEVKKDVPLLAMVTRLARQKGIDLVLQSFDKIIDMGFQFVLLGSGDSEMEEFFEKKAREYPGKVFAQIGFDGVLAQQIYSGADLFLMPSLREPCGLAQMIAARYGTPSIVRKTGGLADTIRPFTGCGLAGAAEKRLSQDAPDSEVGAEKAAYDAMSMDDDGFTLDSELRAETASYESGNGFVFLDKTVDSLVSALEESRKCYEDKESFKILIQRLMEEDFSWQKGALEYQVIYEDLMNEDREEPLGNPPSWLGEGIMYQIFPDRFNRSPKYVAPKIDKNYVLREDWGGEPHKGPFEDGLWNKEFFGGNLRGIIEKLDYLVDLGVTVLYLNPIFEAFSNHRYDTGDYMKIDPLLGTAEDFVELCEASRERGIRIVLDGVFNHTGSDSIYFNKEGRYPGLGAYQSKDSPYYSWYNFEKYPEKYDSWWGMETLPAVRETEPSYMEYIAQGDNSVVRHWMRKGASGFRLDVVDELPDLFLDQVTRAIKEEKEDGCVIGEVWEDASNKIAYGVKRKYFKGKQLDSVMNYPLKDEVLDYLNNHNQGEILSKGMTKLWENYPRRAFQHLMNILSTHDTERILTVLEKSSKNEDEARLKHRIALLIWAFMPGIPCIYYGDEWGYKGGKEPENRRCFVEGQGENDINDVFKEILNFRRGIENIGDLEYAPYIGEAGLFGFIRRDRDQLLLIVVNSGEERSFIWTPLEGQEVVSQLRFLVEENSPFHYTLKKWGGLVIQMKPGATKISKGKLDELSRRD